MINVTQIQDEQVNNSSFEEFYSRNYEGEDKRNSVMMTTESSVPTRTPECEEECERLAGHSTGRGRGRVINTRNPGKQPGQIESGTSDSINLSDPYVSDTGADSCARVLTDVLAQIQEANRQRDRAFERLLDQMDLNRDTSLQSVGRVPTYHIMPDLSKNIENFAGDEKGMLAKEWLDNIEGMRIIHNWPANFALETARMHLRDGARDWYRANSAVLVTWDAFKGAFTRMFVTTDSVTTKWSRMSNRVQQKGESLSSYFHAKNKMCADLKLPFADTKEQILVGLWSRELCTTMAARMHDTAEELYQDIKMYERLMNSRADKIRTLVDTKRGSLNRNTETYVKYNSKDDRVKQIHDKVKNPDRRPPLRNESGEFKCYNCGEFGHISRNCSQPLRERECKKCGGKGHTQRHCTSEASSGPSDRIVTVKTISSAKSGNVGKYLKTVTFADCDFEALIDTGSSDCTLKATCALLNGLPIERETCDIKSFGPSEYRVISPGVIYGDITIDSVKVNGVQVRVVPDDVQPTDMIIGRTFMDIPYVSYHKIGDALTFEHYCGNDINESNERETNIRAMNTVNLPSRSVSLIQVMTNEGQCQLPVVNLCEEVTKVRTGDVCLRGEISTIPVTCGVSEMRQITRSDCNIDEDRPEDEIDDLIRVLNSFRDCIAQNIYELGCAKHVEMDIVEKPNSKPVVSKPYRVSNIEREQIRKIINEWRDAGIVRDTTSPYASPVLLVRKKTGEPRLVVDFRKLNNQTERVHFPLPNIDDHLAEIGEASLFITLDLAHGYLQIPLTPTARIKTAIITPDESVEFTRMIFGLMNGPAYFSMAMHKALAPLRDRAVLFYLDDIMIPGRDWTELREKLIQVLGALRKTGLTIKLRKCEFLKKSVEYLGFEISSKGIRPGVAKTYAIEQFPQPRNVHEVRQFLGLASFFRRFIPNFARKAEPLHKLLRKEELFRWTENEREAFEKLKKLLVERPVLQAFVSTHETELHTDASRKGLGAMLLQRKCARDPLRLVYAISRRTSKVEETYHSSKLELLAIVWAVSRLRYLLINISFKIVTDCQALLYLNTVKTTNAQTIRWRNLLSEFDFDIVHRPGEKMIHVDALSRSPVSNVLTDNLNIERDTCVFTILNEHDEILMYQYKDNELQRKIEILKKPANARSEYEQNETRDYELLNGVLYKRVQKELKYVIPKSMRKGVVIRFHDLRGHMGVERVLCMIQKSFYFPRMRGYVRAHIRACVQCARTKTIPGRQAGQLHPIPPGKRPFETVHIDHVGPFVTSHKNNKYLFVLIDNLTRYVMLRPTKNTKTSAVIKMLTEFVQQYGAPKRLISDRGTCFTANLFERFCETHGIQHILNSPRHPQANGMIERVNATLIPVIQSTLTDDEGRDWDSHIKDVQQYLNDAPNATTQKSPFEMLYGYVARRNEGKLYPLLDPETDYTDPKTLQTNARQHIIQEQERYKRQYDKNRNKNAIFKEGDIVYVRTVPLATGTSTKLQDKFRGPMVVTKRIHGDTYHIADLNDDDPGRRYTTTAHASQLKIWMPHCSDDENQIVYESDSENNENVDIPVKCDSTNQRTDKKEQSKETEKRVRQLRNRQRPKRFDDYVS